MVRCSLHCGDLGGQDDTPGQAGFPGTFLALRSLPALDIPGNTSKANGAPRKYQNRPSSRTGTRSGEDGDSLDVFPGRGGDLSAPGSRQGYGFICRARFWEHGIRHTLVTETRRARATK